MICLADPSPTINVEKTRLSRPMVYNNLTGYLGQTRNFTEDPFTRLPLGGIAEGSSVIPDIPYILRIGFVQYSLPTPDSRRK